MDIILKTEELCKYYGSGENQVKALERVNVEIARGEFTAIVGKSGSGKSTMLHMMGGLDYPSAVFRRRKIGFVFQAFNLVSTVNVWENIVLPMGLDNQKVDEDFVMEIVKTLGLESKLNAFPNTLSGGQQQRAAIARALASHPDIILADEPTGNLDSKTGDEVIGLMKMSVHKFGQTLVMITHDEDIAQMADRIITIEDGRVVS